MSFLSRTCSTSAMPVYSSCSTRVAGYEFQLLHVMHRQHMELAGYPDLPSNGKQLEVMVLQIPVESSNAAQHRTDAPGAVSGTMCLVKGISCLHTVQLSNAAD